MDTIITAVTPLRQRMLEDMRMRKLDPRTQVAYIRAVRKLAAYLHRSPDTASVEDLRNFQLQLVDTGTSPMTLNATQTGLRFFFDVTLQRVDLMARMHPVKLPHKVPVVLSVQETTRLIAAATNIKHQAALSVAYGAGLRASDVVHLKVTDVDGERMTLRVEQGKCRKDRYAMLSPVLLQRLRTWWRVANAQGRMRPGGWLFPGMDPTVFEMRRMQDAEDKITIGYGDLQLTSNDKRLEGYYWTNSPTRGRVSLELLSRDFSGIGSFADAKKARAELLKIKGPAAI